MIGANRYIAAIERSISPRIITNTSPAARIAICAKYGRIVSKLPPLKKLSVFAEK